MEELVDDVDVQILGLHLRHHLPAVRQRDVRQEDGELHLRCSLAGEGREARAGLLLLPADAPQLDGV